jgi:hypothetical protein
MIRIIVGLFPVVDIIQVHQSLMITHTTVQPTKTIRVIGLGILVNLFL